MGVLKFSLSLDRKFFEWDIYSEAKAQPAVLKQNIKTFTPLLDLLLLLFIYYIFC